MPKCLKSSFINFFFLITVILVGILLSTAYYLRGRLELKSPYSFTISNQQTVKNIADKLAADRVIKYPWLFRLTLVLLNKDNKIQAGEYKLEPSTYLTIDSLIKKITSGEVVKYSFRIHDGETTNSILHRLAQEEKLQHTLTFFTTDTTENNTINDPIKNKIIYDSSIINYKELGNLDGLFFPDTYYYISQEVDYKLLKNANTKLLNLLNQLWQTSPYIKKSNPEYYQVIPTAYLALILGSILEKETADKNERSLISGVLYNRLRLGMPLQVDPTVIYALGDNYTGNLNKIDLAIVNPYNTYINKSLPPGPIGSVSASSLYSAINPTQSEYLYFVSKGDGTHHFSKTLEQHIVAVNFYQKNKNKK